LVIYYSLIGLWPSEVANIYYNIIPRNRGVRMIRKEAHLYNFIPTARDDYGVHHIWAKAHARYPTGIIKNSETHAPSEFTYHSV
jgi:hypothetical protein